MEDRILATIREKIADSTREPFPLPVKRDAGTVDLKGKANAVIGMRRAGKTYFLYQCLIERLKRGVERERLVYFNFEDERLGALQAEDLGFVLEEYYRRFPGFRREATVTWCFDEIQVVPGWERFVRRVLDTEAVEVFISGSSAGMLSREVATSMRGRAMETLIAPFSFSEFLRARGIDDTATEDWTGARRQSLLRATFDDYMTTGGFPEAAQIGETRARLRLLQGYVDSVLFRDVAERHGISNLAALRALVRQLLRHPASSFSVTKTHADFRSRGIAVSKETLLDLMHHLVDAFLVFTLPVASRSERARQVNPRKLYLADHALAAAFSPAEGLDRGHLVENVVACELMRRSRDLSYVRTRTGKEVDFLATDFEGRSRLVQVCLEVDARPTLEREFGALVDARAEHPVSEALLLVENLPRTGIHTPEGIEVVPVWRWLLT